MSTVPDEALSAVSACGYPSPGCLRIGARCLPTVFPTTPTPDHQRLQSAKPFLFAGAGTARIWGRGQTAVCDDSVCSAVPAISATRLEKPRRASPAANPYLYMSSQILAGLEWASIGRLDSWPLRRTRPYESKRPAAAKIAGAKRSSPPEGRSFPSSDDAHGARPWSTIYNPTSQTGRDRALPRRKCVRLGAARILRKCSDGAFNLFVQSFGPTRRTSEKVSALACDLHTTNSGIWS